MQSGSLPPFSSFFSGCSRTTDVGYLDGFVVADTPECPPNLDSLFDNLNQQPGFPSIAEISDFYLSPAVINSVSDTPGLPSDLDDLSVQLPSSVAKINDELSVQLPSYDDLSVQLPSSVAEINDRIPEPTLEPTIPTQPNCGNLEDSEILDRLLDDLDHLQQQQIPATVENYNNRKRKRSDSDFSSQDSVSSSCRPMKRIRKKRLKSQDDEVSSSTSSLTAKALDNRQRMQEYRDALAEVRKSIPTRPTEKLTQIDLLKLTRAYIEFLHKIIGWNYTDDRRYSSPDFSGYEYLHDVSSYQDSSGQLNFEKLSQAFFVWRQANGWFNN